LDFGTWGGIVWFPQMNKIIVCGRFSRPANKLAQHFRWHGTDKGPNELSSGGRDGQWGWREVVGGPFSRSTRAQTNCTLAPPARCSSPQPTSHHKGQRK
jgi:hypothetical protein